MVSRVLICCFVLLYSTVLFSQTGREEDMKNYHFIYLDISDNKNRASLTNSIIELLEKIARDDDFFIMYASNGYLPKVFKASHDFNMKERDNIIEFLQFSNPSPPLVRFDKDSILKIWDSFDIKEIAPDNKTYLKYNNLFMHYYVSSNLFGLDEEELVNRLLLVKDVTRKHIDTKRVIIEFHYRSDDAKKFLERQNQLSKSNPSGYKYVFTSY